MSFPATARSPVPVRVRLHRVFQDRADARVAAHELKHECRRLGPSSPSSMVAHCTASSRGRSNAICKLKKSGGLRFDGALPATEQADDDLSLIRIDFALQHFVAGRRDPVTEVGRGDGHERHKSRSPARRAAREFFREPFREARWHLLGLDMFWLVCHRTPIQVAVESPAPPLHRRESSSTEAFVRQRASRRSRAKPIRRKRALRRGRWGFQLLAASGPGSTIASRSSSVREFLHQAPDGSRRSRSSSSALSDLLDEPARGPVDGLRPRAGPHLERRLLLGTAHLPAYAVLPHLPDRRRSAAHLYEFVVPMVPPSWNDADTVAAHAARLRSGSKPTAVAVSTLDVCAPQPSKALTGYWHWD